MHAWGGSVIVRSSPGSGTTVALRIPLGADGLETGGPG